MVTGGDSVTEGSIFDGSGVIREVEDEGGAVTDTKLLVDDLGTGLATGLFVGFEADIVIVFVLATNSGGL